MTLAGRRLCIAGGGTGGHIVPGLHLLDHLVAAGEVPAAVTWLHAGRAVEREVLDGLEERCGGARVTRVPLPLEPAGGGAPALSGLALRLPRATRRARRVLREEGSELLLGLGGYATAPATLAARSLGLPVALLEINAAAGRATRALAPLTRRVFHAWPATLPRRTGARHAVVGPPVAPRFGPVTREARQDARRRLGVPVDAPLVAVLGGSQGAGGLNAFIRGHAGPLLAQGLQLLHQVGPGRLDEAADAATGYRAVEYVRDVPTVLEAATVVLCRAGASTLAEVAAMRVPALAVPYPHHADQHQERNARELGAGVRIVPEADLGPGFAQELGRLAGAQGEAERDAMRAALDGVAPERAAERLAAGLAGLLPTLVHA